MIFKIVVTVLSLVMIGVLFATKATLKRNNEKRAMWLLIILYALGIVGMWI